jgi:hypothetical protein
MNFAIMTELENEEVESLNIGYDENCLSNDGDKIIIGENKIFILLWL